jgi:hypothetical protein
MINHDWIKFLTYYNTSWKGEKLLHAIKSLCLYQLSQTCIPVQKIPCYALSLYRLSFSSLAALSRSFRFQFFCFWKQSILHTQHNCVVSTHQLKLYFTISNTTEVITQCFRDYSHGAHWRLSAVSAFIQLTGCICHEPIFECLFSFHCPVVSLNMVRQMESLLLIHSFYILPNNQPVLSQFPQTYVMLRPACDKWTHTAEWIN